MNLDCLNTTIADRLAIHIDLTNVNSWLDYDTSLTTFSLTKWNGAISDNINLIDLGLTSFDNGRTNIMWSGITVVPNDTMFSMYKVGYNTVNNPTTGQTSGLTATTVFLPITGITASSGNYFNLNGGYLQGFFKLFDYNYTLFPARCNEGITIETVLNIYPESQGIFYMMGARAEDKYNPYFSGETITGITITSGVTTTKDNFLNAIQGNEVNKKAFNLPEDNKEIIYSESNPIDNIKNNVIAFGLTTDKRLYYQYINNEGLLIKNFSSKTITQTGFTLISITFTPDSLISDPDMLDCATQRFGRLVVYVNGRSAWTLDGFPEFYFHEFKNDKEKQLGVPYSISWGGGSFGLEHSWHYDYQTYIIYNGQDQTYINNNFFIQNDPTINDNYLSGLSLSADSTTFTGGTTIRVLYTGGTGTTYFIKFDNPISTLSNRDYTINVSIFDNGFFKDVNGNGDVINNKITLCTYSDTGDITVVNDIEYVYPLTSQYLNETQRLGLHPLSGEYQYIYSNGIMYYGETGLPVLNEFGNPVGYGNVTLSEISDYTAQNAIITGQNDWKKLKSIVKTDNGSGQNTMYIGLLIETSDEFNQNAPLYVKDFTYTASDILVQDQRKNNLMIEQNFNTPFIGGIQKLRLYDKALTSSEIMHNALIEAKTNPNIKVTKGGRIIYR